MWKPCEPVIQVAAECHCRIVFWSHNVLF